MKAPPSRFSHALARVPRHPLAKTGLGLVESGALPAGAAGVTSPSIDAAVSSPSDAAIAQAAQLAVGGNHADAARLVDRLLSMAPSGNAGWILPVEPLINVASFPDQWASVLARLRTRAA